MNEKIEGIGGIEGIVTRTMSNGDITGSVFSYSNDFDEEVIGKDCLAVEMLKLVEHKESKEFPIIMSIRSNFEDFRSTIEKAIEQFRGYMKKRYKKAKDIGVQRPEIYLSKNYICFWVKIDDIYHLLITPEYLVLEPYFKKHLGIKEESARFFCFDEKLRRYVDLPT